MANISDGWWNEDRRDLFSSIEVIASERPDPDRIGLCLDTILNDLELYDDPRQGAGAWLFDDELELAERLGENLHGATGETRPVEAGPTAIASAEWPGARATAIELFRRMETNGDFSR
ncbi:hypothetical protein ACT009_14800 [Sphingomonas sp. Tas61C01]|uniref:hypothetical protein n=1 Tax=Sphingomonas sp. Tas61C01 TaxID=3458297 RepID=UPI00403E8A62